MKKIILLITMIGFGACAGVADANPFVLSGAGNAGSGSAGIAIRYRGHRRGGVSAMFRHWCAYNCYAVPPCCGPSFYGRYGYSHYAYDEDLPFPHRFDNDASPIDNADAFVYRYGTGEPFLRAFERLY